MQSKIRHLTFWIFESTLKFRQKKPNEGKQIGRSSTSTVYFTQWRHIFHVREVLGLCANKKTHTVNVAYFLTCTGKV